MGIDDAEGAILLAQMGERKDEQGVLHDIGEIAGMVAVTIFHGCFQSRRE